MLVVIYLTGFIGFFSFEEIWDKTTEKFFVFTCLLNKIIIILIILIKWFCIICFNNCKFCVFHRKEETPVKSVLEIHEKISELLKHIDKKLQNADTHRLQLEHEIQDLKKKLGGKKKGKIIF